jgi:uncharacterized protein YjdB
MKTILLFFLCLIGQSLSAKTITVTNGNDAGLGSLRNALEQARDGDVIEFSGVVEVTLISSILNINENVTIKGNGTTLRANFSPLMKVATNSTVRWERFNFEVPSNSFAQLTSPRKARVIFEACSGQWEKPNPPMTNTTKNSTDIVMEELRKGGGINYFVPPCPDPDNCGGGGGGGGGDDPAPCTAPFPPNGTLNITNSTCGSNCTLSGGNITIGSVNGTGGTLQFSTDNGTTWNDALPIYNQSNSQIIFASILSSDGCRSASTQVGVTFPDFCFTSTFYRDSDKDGFGAPFDFIQACSAPDGYVENNTDCNDGDGEVNPNSIWYRDFDSDGFGNGTSQQGCYPPSPGYYLEGQLISTSGDCDDFNSEFNPNTIWYRDFDNDGFGDGTSQQGCYPPSPGYYLEGQLISTSGDCYDENSEINPNTIWYRDFDKDGFSDGTSQQSCYPPSAEYYLEGALIATSGDCDDNNNSINPAATEILDGKDNNCNGVFDEGLCLTTTFYYLDADGDGFAIALAIGCVSPGPGYTSNVLPLGDCDDNNAAINPNTLWYEDRDNDGFSSGTTSRGCERREFFYFGGTSSSGKLATELNSLTIDCNDNNAAISPNTVWYKDADNDGYSDGTTQIQCAQPTNFKLASALTATNGDCDENNPNINPGASEVCDGIDNNCNGQIDEGSTSTFYLDSDGDGFGNPSVSLQACLAPENYVTNNTDCDDSRADINPNTVWYEDRDGDGYPSNWTLTGCSRPQFFYGGVFSTTFTLGKLASELTGLTVDCDDTDATVSPGTLWYKDADNDGFSDGTSQQSCFQPSGYKRAGNVVPGGDCNDGDAAINPNTRWYPDLDNDNYSTGNFIVQCARPENYKLLRELTSTVGDCNDNDESINPNTLWFKDQDGDGYTNGQTLRQCSRPENYKLQSELTNFATDCNDLDNEINPVTKWYKDTDNDGYSEGTTVTQCLQPLGYRLESDLIATNGDCNDSDATINPGATEVCGNGKDDDCNLATSDVCALPDTDEDGVADEDDCAPNDATKYRNGNFFIDTDNDGYDNGQAVICYGEAIPTGYKATTLGTDCDDTEAAITVPRTWYQDADNDGYSEGTTVTQCLQPLGYRLESDLIATNGDCNDSDATINPGATEVCGNGKDDDCNLATSDVCALPDTDEDGVADEDDCAPNDATKYRNGTFFIDTDNDGYDNGQAVICYGEEIPNGYKATTFGTDCDDTNAAVTVSRTWYQDTDNDGYSNGNTLTQCTRPQGYKLSSELTATTGDCNNDNSAINPGATEACDGIDNNCNLQTDEGFPDANNNGVADCLDPDNDMIRFTLINAGTNTDILTLTDGLQVSQNQVKGLSLNIRANTNPSVVGSVFISIAGPVNRTITENVAPYALFGDKNGDYNGKNLPSGSYILTATPYSQSNRKGTAGATTTIQFSIVPETVSVTGITTTPSTASIAVGSTLQVTATVLPSNATNKTVVWSTSDQEVATVSASGLVSAISPGEAIITATTQDGNIFDITEVTVTNASPLSIGSFTLINAGPDTDILTLTDGLQISQSQIQGLSLNIRANTNPLVVGSVFLRISGPINRTITENVAPYALFGDKNGNYNGRNLPVGNYTLEATPYSQSNRRGTMGSTRTIKFYITSDAFRMDGTNAESDESDNPEGNADVMEKEVQARDIPRITRMYPNPVAEIINLELSGQVEEHLEVSIYDLKGVRLFNQELKSEDGTLMLDISDLRLKPGMFVLMVNTNGYLQTFKFLKK